MHAKNPEVDLNSFLLLEAEAIRRPGTVHGIQPSEGHDLVKFSVCGYHGDGQELGLLMGAIPIAMMTTLIYRKDLGLITPGRLYGGSKPHRMTPLSIPEKTRNRRVIRKAGKATRGVTGNSARWSCARLQSTTLKQSAWLPRVLFYILNKKCFVERLHSKQAMMSFPIASEISAGRYATHRAKCTETRRSSNW